MTRRIAFVLALAGCFPHQPRLRNATLATEAAMVVGGLVVLSVTPKAQETCTGTSDFPYLGSCNTSHSSLELVGPALLVTGLVGAIVTAASAQPEPAPRPAATPAVAPPAVGDPGTGPLISVAAAWEAARVARAEHRLSDRELHGATFDVIARQWVFEFPAATVTVHESGRVAVSDH